MEQYHIVQGNRVSKRARSAWTVQRALKKFFYSPPTSIETLSLPGFRHTFLKTKGGRLKNGVAMESFGYYGGALRPQGDLPVINHWQMMRFLPRQQRLSHLNNVTRDLLRERLMTRGFFPLAVTYKPKAKYEYSFRADLDSSGSNIVRVHPKQVNAWSTHCCQLNQKIVESLHDQHPVDWDATLDRFSTVWDETFQPTEP